MTGSRPLTTGKLITSDSVFARSQIQTQQAVNSLVACPLTRGSLASTYTDSNGRESPIVLSATSTTLVQHKLGQTYRGWIVTRRQSVPQTQFYADNNGVSQAIGATGTTIMSFSTARYDYSHSYDTSLNRYVAPVGGLYQFSAFIYAVQNATSTKMELLLRVNGATVRYLGTSFGLAPVSIDTGYYGTADIYLARNDYIEIGMYNSGVAQTTRGDFDFDMVFQGGLKDQSGIWEDSTSTADRSIFLPLCCNADQTVELWVF